MIVSRKEIVVRVRANIILLTISSVCAGCQAQQPDAVGSSDAHGIFRDSMAITVNVSTEDGERNLRMTASITNRTERALCVPRFYFPSSSAMQTELFEVVDGASMPLRYVGPVVDPEFPLREYSVLPPQDDVHFG